MNPENRTKMNYNHLFYFWNIAREGSIKRASQLLNVSQPTLSDQLKTFEESIGSRLFDRSGRKLVLNEKGKLVYNSANKMFRIANELSENLKSSSSNLKRIINIGFVPTIAKGLIYEILSPFLVHQEMIMKVMEAEHDLILRAFQNEDLDMIICEKPIFDPEGKTRLFRIFGSTFCVVCSPHFNSARDEFPESLSDIPFMNYTNRTGVQDQILRYFHTKSINPQIIGEVDDVNIIRRFAINGHCFAILPISVIEETLRAGKLIVLSEVPEITIVIHAIVRNKPQNNAVFEILESLQE